MRTPSTPWNLNIHHDRVLVRPRDRVLDVGCGDGFLSAALADLGCEVVGLDVDAGVLARARDRWPDRDITWLQADVMIHPFEPASFDAVLSNAALHHLPDTEEVLRRMGELVRPRGRLGVVGFARNGPLDWPLSLLGMVAIVVVQRIRGKWEHTAPIAWPPALTYGQTRDVARRALPGSRFRRVLLGRYLLDWTRPR